MIQTKKTETIVAKFNLSIVLLTIVWKSIGLDWLPMGLGQAFNSIFDPSDNYYPRHDRHETAYNLFYLLLYGIFGLVAQWSSLKLVHDNNDNNNNVPSDSDLFAKRAFGAFHTSIAAYHILYAFRVVEGKLLMDRMLKMTAENKGTTMALLATTILPRLLYSMELFVAVQFILQPYDASRKLILDLLSMSNLVPLNLCFMMKIVGFENDMLVFVMNTSFYIVIPYTLLLMSVMSMLSTAKHKKVKSS